MKKLLLILLTFSLSMPSIFAQMPGMMGGGERRAGQSTQMGPPGMRSSEQQKSEQEVGDGRIKGSLIDSVTQKPVEFATVSLFKKDNPNVPVDGTMSDELGKFLLKDLPDGDYYIKISFIGYEDKVIALPKTAKEKKKFSLEGTVLSPSTKVLDEVTVTGQKTLLEDKVDRLVYNAEVDKTSQGGNASDVLRKVPMLTVDLDGNLSMRGSQNVRVLINNKPSTIMASSVADALKQIPAEMIKTVEVITSPSAKYDGEGTAGIINIITKKNNLQGLTGMINASAGNRGSNLFGNINYRQGKLGVSLNGGGNAFYNPSETTTKIQTTTPIGVLNTNQFSNNFDNGLFGNAQFSTDYEINSKNTIYGGIRYGQRGFNSTQEVTSSTFKSNDMISSFNRNVDNINQNRNIDANLDYVRKFENSQKEFGILTQFSQSMNDNSFNADVLVANALQSRQKNDNTGNTREFTIQTDFQTPIGKTQIFEIGAKNIYRNISNTYSYLKGNTEGDYVADSLLPANEFTLAQNISSGYVSYTYTSASKFSVKPGLRYEYTLNDASLKNNEKLDVADYGNLIPSLQLSKGLGGGKTIKASYNRRIQRPSLRFLSPNVNVSNPLNISVGNPELLPELTNAYELAFSAFKKATTINLSLFFRDTKDAITQVRTVLNNGGIYTEYQNIGEEKSYGANIFGSTRITQKWQLNLGTNIYYQTLASNDQTNQGWVVEGNYFLMGQLGKGFAFQSFGFLRGPRVQLQGRQAGFGMMNLGVRKDFTNKKGSIGIGIDNPFMKGIKTTSTFESTGLYQESVNIRYNRGVRLMFSYQFGKMTFGNTARRKRISNDDSKSDDTGNQGGGGQGGSGMGGRQ